MPPKAKSAVATDNAWTPGRSKNHDVCMLKDTLYGSTLGIIVFKYVSDTGNTKKQQTIQVIEFHDLPKPKGLPVRNHQNNSLGSNHNRHRMAVAKSERDAIFLGFYNSDMCKVAKDHVSGLCLKVHECLIGGIWLDLASLMIDFVDLVLFKASDK
ncbi:hypothetical protein Tco_0157527, partial [Tanacetum coccineum]